MMKLGDLHGYEVHIPMSGGKAGKGNNVTSTLQIRRDGCIVKQIRFVLTDPSGRSEAVRKAKDYITGRVAS